MIAKICIVGIIIAAILVGVPIAYMQLTGTEAGVIQTVNASDTEQHTYHLGDKIYSEGTSTYYYHGIDSGYNIVIGHSIWEGGDQAGFSNIYITLVISNKPQTFYLENQQFELVSYEKNDGATITLIKK